PSCRSLTFHTNRHRRVTLFGNVTRNVRCAKLRTRRTNRWTGATGSVFRIKRDPAKLLGSAVARSTHTLGSSRGNTADNVLKGDHSSEKGSSNSDADIYGTLCCSWSDEDR